MIRRSANRNADSDSSGSLQDLSFLLIIFFIVIAGFNVNKGFLLNLPSKDKPKIVNNQDLMKCVLKADGTILLDGNQCSVEELKVKIQSKLNQWPNMTFLLTIAPDASYQSVIDIIYEIRELDVENFSFRME